MESQARMWNAKLSLRRPRTAPWPVCRLAHMHRNSTNVRRRSRFKMDGSAPAHVLGLSTHSERLNSNNVELSHDTSFARNLRVVAFHSPLLAPSRCCEARDTRIAPQERSLGDGIYLNGHQHVVSIQLFSENIPLKCLNAEMAARKRSLSRVHIRLRAPRVATVTLARI